MSTASRQSRLMRATERKAPPLQSTGSPYLEDAELGMVLFGSQRDGWKSRCLGGHAASKPLIDASMHQYLTRGGSGLGQLDQGRVARTR